MVSAGHGQAFSVIDGFGREEERGSLATTRWLDFSWGDFGEIHLFFCFPAGNPRVAPAKRRVSTAVSNLRKRYSP